MPDFKYLIVGGGLAAARACDGIRELDGEGSIAIVTTEPHIPYHRPPLSKAYLRGKRSRARLNVHPEAWYAERGIELLTGREATRITRRSRRVQLADGETLGYEELLLATGGRAWRLPLSGADLPGVQTLRTVDDSQAIREQAQAARRVVVIGGSFVGIEVAASLASLNVPVTVCFLEQYPLQSVVPPELGQHVRALLEQHGVRVVPATRPERIEGDERVRAVHLEDGTLVEADLVVMGVGIRLNTALARDAELDLAEMSAVVVDERLRTSDPHIYAAGDIAAWPDPHSRQRTRVEHWDVAYHQGLCAGRNMAGAGESYDRLPAFFSDIFDLSLEAWGQLSKPDTILHQGALATGTIVYWYLKGDRVCGALAVGISDAAREALPAIVAEAPTVAEARASLADADAAFGRMM